MKNIGYKINGLWHSQAYPIATQLGVSVVVNNLALARAIADTGKMVVHRFTHLNGVQDEGFSNWHKSITPELYAQKLIQAHGNNPDIWIYAFNEPNVGNPRDMELFIDYAISAFRYIINAGYKVVGLNTPPASYPINWVNSGVYDRLMQFANDNRNRFIIGYHDYSDFALVRFGQNDEKDYDRLDDRSYVSPSNWSNNVNPDTSWHLHHISRLTRRADAKGLAIRLGATELGYSVMPDTANLSGVRRMQTKYPSSLPNTNLNGQATLKNYWADVYPDKMWEQVVIDQIAHYAKVAPRQVEFATLYAFGFGGGEGQDFWNDNRFHSMLIDLQKSLSATTTPPIAPPPIIPPTIPPPNGKSVKLSSTGCSTRIRSKPSVFSAVVGYVKCQTPAELLGEENGWYRILYNGKIAYTSKQYVIVE